MSIMNERDNVLKAHAINLWANFIETGDISISAEDARNMNKKTKELDNEQIDFVKRLRTLSIKTNSD